MNICLFTEEEVSRPLAKADERNKHIVEVLRKKAGDTFAAGIIGKEAGIATIVRIDENGGIVFSFEPKSDGKPLRPLTLIIGFPRPIQLRRLLRDVAGLGAKRIILSGTELTEKSYLATNDIKDGAAEKMLLDGTVQAGSTHIPELVVVPSLEEALSLAVRTESGASRIALDNRRARTSLGETLSLMEAKSVVAAIGSERGWTDRERDALEGAGFTLCSMGTRVLRTETAATVASALILDKLGFLD